MKFLVLILYVVFVCFLIIQNVRCEGNYTTTTAAEEAGLSQKNLTNILLTEGNLSAYEPSAVVRGFHNLPHLDKNAIAVKDPKFKAGNDPEKDDYNKSLIGFPTIFFILGLIALVLLQLGILGYMDWLVPPLGPQEENEDAGSSEIALWTHKVEMSRKMWVIYFFVALCIAVFGNHIMFYGDDLYNKGFEELSDSLQILTNMVNTIGTSSAAIGTAFQFVEQMALDSASTCPQMGDPSIAELIDNEEEALSEMNFNTEVIKEAVVDAHEDLIFYNSKKDALFWTFYAVCLTVLICFVAAFFTKQSFYMNISIIVSQVIMVGLMALCSIEMAFMMGLGDFCMDPTGSVIDSLDGEDILQRTAKFYSLCTGEAGNGDNFIHRALAQAYEKRRQLGRALQILYMPVGKLSADIPRDPDVPVCERYTIDKNVQDAFYALQALAPDFQGIAAAVACDQLHPRWRLTFEVAVCQNTLLGVLALWWAQIITTAGLFLTSIAASVMMLYFDKFWDIAGTNKEKVDSLTTGDNSDPYAVESDTTESNPVSMGTRSDGYTPVASTTV